MNDDTSDDTQRTLWAEDRTVLANERTFSAWMGTGLGCAGVAIGLQAVFGAFEPARAATTAATIFPVTAIVIYRAARRQACKTRKRLSDNDAETTPIRSFTWLAGLMTIATAATSGILWSL